MAETGADDEEDDIYKNLPDFKYDDSLKKLENANKELEARVRHLEKQHHEITEENLKLKEENRHLHENISSLLKTANNELKRKDHIIEELRRENNQLVFRRKGRSHKKEVECHEHTVDRSIHQKQEFAANCSNVQQYGEALQLKPATSNKVKAIVKDVESILKADNSMPITQTCTPKSGAQYSDEVNDVSILEVKPSASAEVFPVDSVQDNYRTLEVQRKVETVFSARMRKRLNAHTKDNKKENVASTNSKQLSVSGSHNEEVSRNRENKRPNNETATLNNQERKAIEIVKEVIRTEEKSVTCINTLSELESNSSGSLEFHSVDAIQDHHCATQVPKNVVETVSSERKRKQLNASTEKAGKEILVCSGSKQSLDSRTDEAERNNNKEERERHNDARGLNTTSELDATEIQKEAPQNDTKSVNADNVLGEFESNSSRSIKLHAKDTKQDCNSTTDVLKNVVGTVFREQIRNKLNVSEEKDDTEIPVCTNIKPSCDSRINEAKINSSKEEGEANDETPTHNNQKLKATGIVKEATQYEGKSVNVDNILIELDSSGSVEVNSVDANEAYHDNAKVQSKMAETVFSKRARKQLNASTEKDSEEILACTGNKQSCDSKIDEAKIDSSKDERETNPEKGRLKTVQELEVIEIEKGSTQTERSVSADNIIGELESTSFIPVDAMQDCRSTTDTEENVVETFFSEQMRKQLNASTERDGKEMLACSATEQSHDSRVDDAKIESNKEKSETNNETHRLNTVQELEAPEIEKQSTQEGRKLVNTANIVELESDSSVSVELHSVDAEQDYNCTTEGQKNVSETVFSSQMRKESNASIEAEHNEILVCTNINSTIEERDENNDIPENNTLKNIEPIKTLKEVPSNERTFVNADNVLVELKGNLCQPVEFQSVDAKQDHHCTTQVQNDVVKAVVIEQVKKQLNASKETDDKEALGYSHTKQPNDCRSCDENITIKEREGDVTDNDTLGEHNTVQKFESNTNVKEVSFNKRKFADTGNILVKEPFTDEYSDCGSKNSRPEHVNARTSLNEQCCYNVDSKNHNSHVLDTRSQSPAFQKRRRSTSQSSSTRNSPIESCVIQSEQQQNAQKLLHRESTKHAKRDVKTNYHITGKYTAIIRPVKASASVRTANSVKSKYSRSRSKTPFDGSRFKIPKLSPKQRVRIERTSVLEQNDSDSDSSRIRYPRQYSLHSSHRPYTSYRSRSRVRQSFRDGQHYAEHRKYKHRDSSLAKERSSSHYKHERRHSSVKFHDKDKRHIATRRPNVSKSPNSTRMETTGSLKKNVYFTDAEKVVHSQKQARNVDFSLEDYRREIVTGKREEKYSNPSQKISEHRKTVENYTDRKTQRTKSLSLKEINKTENICKQNEYKLKKITFENNEYKKPVSNLYQRLLANSHSKPDRIKETPELFDNITNEPNHICSSDSALLATEEQRKENAASFSDPQNVSGQANEAERKQKKFCNSAVFKADGVSVSIFRETCDFSTSRKRRSVVISSQRTSGSHDLDSPEEKRQRLNHDNVTVETTSASVMMVHDSTTKRAQSAVEETALIENGVTIPVRSSIGGSRTETVQYNSCVTDKQHPLVNDLSKLNHKLDLDDIKIQNEKDDNTALYSEYVSDMTNEVAVSRALSLNVENCLDSKGGCIPQEVTCGKVSANEEGLHCSTECCSDDHELRFKKVRVEHLGARDRSKRECTREKRIEDMREELEEGEILDDSPVKTSTVVARFPELVHNLTLEHSCHRNVSKEVSQHINPSCNRYLQQFADTLGENKSSKRNRHSISSPTLRDNLLHKEHQHHTHAREKIVDFETTSKCKVVDKFQSSGSEDSGVTTKQSSQAMKAKEVKTSINMSENMQDVEAVTLEEAKFEKESHDANNFTSTSTNKDCNENGKPGSCQMNDTVADSIVSKNICLLTNDSESTESGRHWNKESDRNEMKCKIDEAQASGDLKSLKEDFSSVKQITVTADENLYLPVETVSRPEETCKQIDDRKNDKIKLSESCLIALSSDDTVNKDVDDSNRQMPEPDNLQVSSIDLQKETQPKSCQKPSSECDIKTNEENIEQTSKGRVKSVTTPLSSRLVSPQRRKKNARMTISTSQSSLQSEILMANLLQTHSPYKVGIHDESLPVSIKYTEEIASGTCDNNGLPICNTSKGSINTQSDDKHDSNSQRATRSKTTRMSPLSCQADERKSLKSPKEKMQKLMNYEKEQINVEEKHHQSEVQDTNYVCNYIAAEDLNVNKHLVYDTTFAHTSRELKSDNYQVVTNDRKDEAILQEISEETINESRQSVKKDSMKITADGCAEIQGGKEPLSAEELLKILEGSFEKESGGSENVAKESDSLQPENAVMSSPQQSEISVTKDLANATNKKNIIIRRRSRKCVLEEAPMKFITITPLDDTNPNNLIDSSVAVSIDEPSSNNHSPICVTPSVPLCLQHDDDSCSSSSSASSSSSSVSSCSSSSSSCSNSSSSMSLRSSVSGSSKSSTSGQEEVSDKDNNIRTLRKSLRVTPARRLYQLKAQMVVHQPQNDYQDPQDLEMSLNSSSSGNTSDDTYDPKKGHEKQLNCTWVKVKKKRPRNRR